jgi:hypothetical protein
MNFHITGLRGAQFAPLFGLSDAELAQYAAVRKVVDRYPGYPCRVSLLDAPVGETVLLVNYTHLPAPASPYRSQHAIFVRQAVADACLAVNEIPASLATRLLAVRAFDSAAMMLDADVLPGYDLASAIGRMLANPAVAFLHVHNAKAGCYAARVDRAA